MSRRCLQTLLCVALRIHPQTQSRKQCVLWGGGLGPRRVAPGGVSPALQQELRKGRVRNGPVPSVQTMHLWFAVSLEAHPLDTAQPGLNVPAGTLACWVYFWVHPLRLLLDPGG